MIISMIMAFMMPIVVDLFKSYVGFHVVDFWVFHKHDAYQNRAELDLEKETHKFKTA